VSDPILLIDLSSLVHPLFHLSGDQPDVNWTSNQAVAKVYALANGSPHVAICADRGRSFRRELDPTYKANRPEKDAALFDQLNRTERVLSDDGFPIWAADGYEADDIIARAVWGLTVQHPVKNSLRIASADKDLLQLVNDVAGVSVVSLKTGQLIDEAAVLEKFKVTPAQMRDYLTLVGDSADNIKGAPGIGPVKAAELLKTFGSLDSVMAHLEDVTPRTKQTLTEHGLALERARLLVTLKTDAPIDVSEVFMLRVPKPKERDVMAEMVEQMDQEADVSETKGEIRDSGMLAELKNYDAKHGVSATADNNQITKVEVEPFTGAWSRALEPRSARDTMAIARVLFDSRFFAGYGNPQAVAAIIFAGRELNLGMMASLRGFYNVKGKVCMAADLMRALVLASPVCEYFTCTERSATKATWVTKRKGDPTSTTLTFTLEEAQKAGLVTPGSSWDRHQADMVAKTGSSKLCRLSYADVTFGLYSLEEMGGDE
jgi:5'-3' exonuclease